MQIHVDARHLIADVAVALDVSGRDHLVVVAKAAWRIPEPGQRPRPIAPEPLVVTDQFHGEPGLSALRYGNDFARFKPRCDVLFDACAHAPMSGGRQTPVRQMEVAVQVGAMRKRVRVTGPRRWQSALAGMQLSEPEPFTRMPLHHGLAYGGSRWYRQGDARWCETLMSNPVGLGYAGRKTVGQMDGEPAPCLEDPQRPVRTPDGEYPPVALSAIARHWKPRFAVAAPAARDPRAGLELCFIAPPVGPAGPTAGGLCWLPARHRSDRGGRLMLHWLRHTEGHAPATPRAVLPPLLVTARAMCCALGHHAAAASAAMNARMNHFRASDFVDDQGEPVRAGMVHGLNRWGSERLAALLNQVLGEVLGEVLRPLGRLQPGSIRVLVNGPEASRCGLPIEALQADLGHAIARYPQLGEAFVVPQGQGGFAGTLHLAARWLTHADGDGQDSQVLVVGLDSLLFAGSIEQFLAQGRLATSAMSDGLVPAEGAAALLLCCAAPGAEGLLRIESAVCTQDPWRLGGGQAQRAVGLTQAVRLALADARVGLADLDFQLSGMTGEGWYARETALMQSRCMTHRRERFAHLVPSQFLGFCAGAIPVLGLAWLADLMTRADEAFSPGGCALAHFADPCGARSALVLRQHSGPARPDALTPSIPAMTRPRA